MINLKELAGGGWRLVFILLTLSVFFLSLDLRPLSALCVVLTLAYVFPLKKAGPITRFMLALTFYASFNSILAIIFWVARISLPTGLLLGIYIAGLFLIVLFARSIFEPYLPQNLKTQKEEWIGLVIALMVGVIAFLPFWSDRRDTNLIRILGAGGDNLSHLELSRATDQSHGLIYGNLDEIGDKVTEKLLAYPEGWHFNQSTAKQLIESMFGQLNLQKTLLLYHFVAAAWLALLSFFLALLSFRLAQAAVSDPTVAIMSGVFSSLVLISAQLFAFFSYGFQTQLAAFALFLAELLCLLTLYEADNERESTIGLILALIFATATSFVWLFIWPVAMAAVGVVLIDSLGLNLKNFTRRLPYLVLTLLFTGLGTLQIWIQSRFAVDGQGNHLNEPGFIPDVNNFLLLALLLTSLIYYIRRRNNPLVRLIGLAASMAAIFSLAVMAYQLSTVGEVRYFFFKSTYTFVLLAAILLSGLVAEIMAIMVNEDKNRRVTLILLGIFIGALVWTSGSKPTRLYIEQKPYGMSEEVADAIASIAKYQPDRADRVVALGSCNREQDIKAIRWLMPLTGKTNLRQQGIAETQMLTSQKLTVFRQIKQYQQKLPDGRLIILAGDETMGQQLLGYLGSEADKVTLVDLDPGRTKKTEVTCPQLLR